MIYCINPCHTLNHYVFVRILIHSFSFWKNTDFYMVFCLLQTYGHYDEVNDQYQCMICKRKCVSEQALQDHFKTHFNNHCKCPFCERTFYNKNDLTGHISSHTGQRDFRCHICDKEYGHKSHLRRHIKLKHSNVSMDGVESENLLPGVPALGAFNKYNTTIHNTVINKKVSNHN